MILYNWANRFEVSHNFNLFFIFILKGQEFVKAQDRLEDLGLLTSNNAYLGNGHPNDLG